jgi:hypothetical protein
MAKKKSHGCDRGHKEGLVKRHVYFCKCFIMQVGSQAFRQVTGTVLR